MSRIRYHKKDLNLEFASDAPNGCDPATAIGGFLLFPALKAWCEGQGITEFGVYGKKK